MKTYTNYKKGLRLVVGVFALALIMLPAGTAHADPYSYDGGFGGDTGYFLDSFDSGYSYGGGFGGDTGYYLDSFGGGYSSGGGYAAASPSYVYQPAPAYSVGGGYQAFPNYQYVYTTPSAGSSNYNANSNSNSNTNTITNTFNPVNNNDARINLVVLGGGTGGSTNNYQDLSGACVITPSTAYVNQDVTFSASASGGNGGYTYSWTGDNGINSSSQTFTGRFSYVGVKNATVTIRSSDGQTITRTCSTNVQDTYYPPVVGGAYCVANPTNAGVNQNVTWTVYPAGNVYGGNYTYSWSGTDGLMGYGQTISRIYNTPGYKTATVTMYGNGQTITANCATTVQGGLSNVTVLRDQTLGTPVGGVFLNQVPETGISFGLKMTLFVLGLIMWSIFGAYVFSRKTKLASANGADLGDTTLSRIEAFKRANMAKKGIL